MTSSFTWLGDAGQLVGGIPLDQSIDYVVPVDTAASVHASPLSGHPYVVHNTNTHWLRVRFLIILQDNFDVLECRINDKKSLRFHHFEWALSKMTYTCWASVFHISVSSQFARDVSSDYTLSATTTYGHPQWCCTGCSDTPMLRLWCNQLAPTNRSKCNSSYRNFDNRNLFACSAHVQYFSFLNPVDQLKGLETRLPSQKQPNQP